MNVSFRLNGRTLTVPVRADEPLLDVLRRLGVRGCRLSCGIGICGTCTAVVDGDLVASCIHLALLADGCDVRTVEDLSPDDAVVRAFVDKCAVQCGYCTPGMVLTAKNLVEDPSCTHEEVLEGMAGNLCRCGCYPKIAAALELLASTRHSELEKEQEACD